MTKDGSLAEAGLRRLIDDLIAAGVHGIFTSGTAGEFWALSVQEKVFSWTVEATEGRVPRRLVDFGLQDTDMRVQRTLGDTKHARLNEVFGEGLVAGDVAQLRVRRHGWPNTTIADLNIWIAVTFKFYAFFAFYLAVLQQQLATAVHALANRVDVGLRDHSLDDTEALDSQRFQIPLDFGVTPFRDSCADGVGEPQSIVKRWELGHGFTNRGEGEWSDDEGQPRAARAMDQGLRSNPPVCRPADRCNPRSRIMSGNMAIESLYRDGTFVSE